MCTHIIDDYLIIIPMINDLFMGLNHLRDLRRFKGNKFEMLLLDQAQQIILKQILDSFLLFFEE